MKALGKQQGLTSITYTTYHVKRTAVFLFPLLDKCCGYASPRLIHYEDKHFVATCRLPP
jgi:hypothetical protein